MLEERKRTEDTAIICKICLTDIEINPDLNPLECGHFFHPECLAQFFEGKILEKSFPLICPEVECKKDVHPSDLKGRISAELLEKFSDFTLKNLVEMNPETYSCCPTPDCPFMFEFDNTNGMDFICSFCKKHYCLACRVIFHKDMTCKEF